MGYSKEQLLSRLQELQISFAQYDHPVALTVEELDKYVGHLKGGVTKNLFLKDKKQRFYIVSALTDTKVDLKVLSQRLGLGKGGLRMAPEETLGEILQVPLGCVTPFALLNETTRHVSLLLDRGFKTQECCLFHPLSNDTSISLTTHDLDNFLKSIGREPAYVDLEANPSVGKDQPPDLAAFVPSEIQVLLDATQKMTSLQEPQKASVAVNTVTPSNNSQKGKLKTAVSLSTSFADPDKFVDKILEKTSALLLSEIKEENVKQHGEQLGSVVSNSIRRQLSLELKNLAIIGSPKMMSLEKKVCTYVWATNWKNLEQSSYLPY